MPKKQPAPVSILDYARKYEALGLITFPCRHQPGDPSWNKTPLVKWSSEWARRSSDWRLAEWGKYASRIDILIGSCPGKYVVIDVDKPDLWRDFIEYRRKSHGEAHVWTFGSKCPLTITPRGGEHIWLDACGHDGKIGKNERQQWGFDWRSGTAGYVIVPGPKGAWSWARALWDTPAPPIPDAVLAFLLGEQTRGLSSEGQPSPFGPSLTAQDPSLVITQDPDREYRIQSYLEALPFRRGTRNTSTHQLARWILTDLAGTVDEAIAWAFRFHEIWSAFGQPPLPESEIRSTVISAARGIGRRQVGCALAPVANAPIPPTVAKSATVDTPTKSDDTRTDVPAAPPAEKPIEIVTRLRDRTLTRNRAYNAAILTNERRRWIYRFGGAAGAVEGTPGDCEFYAFEVNRFQNRLLDRCPVVLEKMGKRGPVYTPDQLGDREVQLVLDLLGQSDEVPEIRMVARGPVYVEGGTLLQARGYDEISRVYLDLPGDFNLGKIDTSSESVERAVDLLTLDFLGDFRWQSSADLAHYLGAILTPFVRPLLPGCPVPAVIIDAPTKGSGKTLLAELAGIISTGRRPTPRAWPTDEAETQKALLALVMSGAGTVLFDNVSGKIKSPTLDGFLTSVQWSGRVLGESRIIRAPNNTQIWFTSNNAEIGGDLARRCVRVRIDTGEERPWLRSGFRHPRLLDWAQQHRVDLCRACCVLVGAWIGAGAMNGSATLGSFDAWAAVLSGILETVGVGGFLDKAAMAAVEAESDEEGAERRAFVEGLWDEVGERYMTPAEIAELCERHDLLSGVLGGKFGHAGVCRVGRFLNKLRDLVFTGIGTPPRTVRVRRTTTNPRRYWVEPAS